MALERWDSVAEVEVTAEGSDVLIGSSSGMLVGRIGVVVLAVICAWRVGLEERRVVSWWRMERTWEGFWSCDMVGD
jgi:hypothetical protein